MNRKTNLLVLTLLAAAPLLSAQQAQNESAPTFPADIFPNQQLIAWSWMQEPQPLRQAGAPQNGAAGNPSQSSAPPENRDARPSNPAQPNTQNPTGKATTKSGIDQ